MIRPPLSLQGVLQTVKSCLPKHGSDTPVLRDLENTYTNCEVSHALLYNRVGRSAMARAVLVRLPYIHPTQNRA
eukprot:244982-Pleurochrysis_carterae.AAC.1